MVLNLVRILESIVLAALLFMTIGLMLDVPAPGTGTIVLGIVIPAVGIYVFIGKIERWLRR